jgi:hypothetical protein
MLEKLVVFFALIPTLIMISPKMKFQIIGYLLYFFDNILALWYYFGTHQFYLTFEFAIYLIVDVIALLVRFPKWNQKEPEEKEESDDSQ